MNHIQQISTARLTGIWYLLLAISGVFGFLIFQSQIFIENNPSETLKNLTLQKTNSQLRLAFEFLIIVSQALTAVWFYKLFGEIKAWAAFAIAGWGLMNAAAIMVSAISIAVAMDVAETPMIPFEEKSNYIQLLSFTISNAWRVGSIFFGLWLIPMGYVVYISRRMPVWMGRILMIGGLGYVLSAFFNDLGVTTDLLTIPATIGEFWMIGYLLVYGIRPETHTK